MTRPTKASIHADKPMTNFSVAYMQNATMISRSVAPVVPVDEVSGIYFEEQRGFKNRVSSKEMSYGSAYPNGSLNWDEKSYACKKHGLAHPTPDELKAIADNSIQYDKARTEYVTSNVMLEEEVNWKTKFFGASIWTTDVVGGVGFTQWSTSATATPLDDIQKQILTIKTLTGLRPNNLILAPDSYDAITRCKTVIDKIKTTVANGFAQPMVAAIGAYLGVQVFIGDAIQNTAAETQATSGGETNSFVFADGALLCYTAPRVALRVPTAMMTPVWTGMPGLSKQGTMIERIPDKMHDSDIIRIKSYYDQVLVSADLGVFFSDTIA